jgi:hypothetical protein
MANFFGSMNGTSNTTIQRLTDSIGCLARRPQDGHRIVGRMESSEIGHVNEKDESVSEQQRAVSDSQSVNDRDDPYGGRWSPKWDRRCHFGSDRLVIKAHQMTAGPT